MNLMSCYTKPHFDFFNDIENFMGPCSGQTFEGGSPHVNVVEDEQAFHLTATVPGFSRDDISVEVQEDTLTLKGVVEKEHDETKENYSVREFESTNFERRFRLGEAIDQENITATVEQGLLKVEFPKKPKAQPRKIEVSVN